MVPIGRKLAYVNGFKLGTDLVGLHDILISYSSLFKQTEFTTHRSYTELEIKVRLIPL